MGHDSWPDGGIKRGELNIITAGEGTGDSVSDMSTFPVPGGKALKFEELKWTKKFTVRVQLAYPFFLVFCNVPFEIRSARDIPMVVKHCMENNGLNQRTFGGGFCEVYNRGAKDVVITREPNGTT